MQLEHHISRRASSITDLWRVLRLTPRRPSRYSKQDEWRLIQPPEQGCFAGIESTCCVALATDGVHIIGEKPTGEIIEGHVLNWVKDKPVRESVTRTSEGDDEKADAEDRRTARRSQAAQAVLDMIVD